MNNHYIKRKLMKKEEYYKFGEYAPFFEEGFSDLHTLITAKTKKIVLLSDAGYGKSTELKTIINKLINLKVKQNSIVKARLFSIVKKQKN